MSYIETTDIKHSKLASKVGATDITDTDAWFEVFVLSKNVEVSEIPATLNDEVKTMLIYKTSMDIAERYIGINPRQRARGESGLSDTYEDLFKHFQKQYMTYRNKMNRELILNVINDQTDLVGDGIELYRS